MNKKTLLLTLTAGCTALGVTTITLSNSGVFTLFAGSGEPRTHTIYFNKDNTAVDLGTYDEVYWSYPISFYQEDAIVVSETQKYKLESFDDIEFTYLYGEEGHYTAGTTSLISFTCDKTELLTVYFALEEAELNESASFIAFTHNGVYNNSNTFHFASWDDGTYYYYATISFASFFGEAIEITEIKLVFTCEAEAIPF